jgi:hypothetical protein
MDLDGWQLTMYFAAGGLGKAESTEKLMFPSKASAESALAEYANSADKKTTKVFRVENEAGEYVVFEGVHLRRYSVKKALDL